MKQPAPLGSNLPRAYRALIERLEERKREGARPGYFAKTTQVVVVRGNAWVYADVRSVAKGAAVIWFDEGFIGTGPFEHVIEGGVVKNVDGGFYATIRADRDQVKLITEREFYALFMRPWSFLRRKRWEWARCWS